jgi:Secretion system C-terminal sorting domain
MENKGQIMGHDGKTMENILYKTSAAGMNMYLRNDGFSYLVLKSKNNDTPVEKFDINHASTEFEYHRIDMTLLGANASAEIIQEQKANYYENYYRGSLTATNVSGFSKITYKNIYSNIDWVIYSREGQIKYDFVVHPGGNPSDIKMNYQGSGGIQIQADGSLNLATTMNIITEQKPFTFDNNKKEINSRFSLKEQIVGFDLSEYNKANTITIDPGILWGTYFGGTNGENANSVKFDNDGNVIIGGRTTSSDLLMDASFYSYSGTYANTGFGGYLAKFNAAGQLLWATYYDGNDQTSINAVDIASNNHIYAAGATFSTNLPMQNAFQNSNNGIKTGFVTKFNDTGYLTHGSYIGGNNVDEIMSVAVDNNDNLYMAGFTTSGTGIGFGSGQFQTPLGGEDVMLVKLNANFTPAWGTYYGGVDNDKGYGIDLYRDSSYIYIAGETYSPSGIAFNTTEGNTYQGNKDGFLAKWTLNGTLISGRYYGGSGDDAVNAVDCDESLLNLVAIAGTTNSTTGIANSNQQALGGGTDAFLANFRLDITVISATYVGGSGNEKGNGVMSWYGNTYIVGESYSAINFSTSNAYQPSYNGNGDGFIGKYQWFGFSNEFMTYYGGYSADQLFAIDERNGILAVAGEAASYENGTQGIYAGNGYQNDNHNVNGWTTCLALFASECNNTPNPVTINTSNGSNEFCQGSTLILNASGANSFQWVGGPAGNSFPITTDGTYQVNGSRYGCNFSSSITINTNPVPTVDALPSGAQYICPGQSATFYADAPTATSYQWFRNGVSMSGQTNDSLTVSQQGFYTVAATNIFGCSSTSFPVQLFVNTPPNASITANGSSTICSGASLNLQANNATVTYTWLRDGVVISGAFLNHYTATQSGVYTVIETSPNGCTSTSNSITVTVLPYPAPVINFSGPPYTCLGNLVLHTAYNSNYTYQWLLNNGNIGGATDTTYTASTGGNYSVIVSNGGICSTTSTAVVMNPTPQAPTICMVSVDNNSEHNNIYWDKTPYNYITSFKIYRDTANNNYALVGTVPYWDESVFADTARFLYAANGDPNISSWRYKISMVDTCGTESPLSPYHQTMFLQNNSGNFSWNQYQIEGQSTPVAGLSQYSCDRDPFGLNQWAPFATISASSTAITDPDFAAYPNGSWRTKTIWNISCDPSRVNINTTRSNIKKPTTSININEYNSNGGVSLYPNPTNELFVVASANSAIQNLVVYNALGEVVYKNTNQTQQQKIEVSTWNQGVYFVEITNEQGRVVKKLVKE